MPFRFSSTFKIFRDERFESRTSILHIYIAVAAYYLNKSCGSVNTYLLYWLKNARPPFYARNLAPPGSLCLFHVTHCARISFVGHVARQRFSAQAHGGHLALTFDSDILIEFRVELREILVSHVRATSWRKISGGKCNAINDEFRVFYLGEEILSR